MDMRRVHKVADVPVRPGALVACDLDDTIIRTQSKSVALMHPDDAAWCFKAIENATLVYITARDISSHDLTHTQLLALGLPMCPSTFL